MTLKIANGTPVSGDRLEVEGTVVKLFRIHNKPKSSSMILVLAYALRPGEILRQDGDNYEVS